MWKFLESRADQQRPTHRSYQLHCSWTFWSGEMRCRNAEGEEQGKIASSGVPAAPGSLAAIASGGFDAVQISYSLLDLQMEDGG